MSDVNPAKRNLVEGLGPASMMAILLLGSALSVYVWRDLQRQWDGQVDAVASSFTTRLGATIGEQTERLYGQLRRSARFWDGAAIRANQAIWNDATSTFLADNPAVLGVVLTDAGWQLAPPAIESQRLLNEAMPKLRAGQTDDDFVSEPVRLANGAVVMGMQVALADAPKQRSLFALVDVRRLVEGAIGNRAPSYGVQIRSGDDVVFDRAPQGEILPEWRKTQELLLPLGRQWTLETTPSDEAIATPPRHTATIALLGGLLGSGLIAASLHFGTLAWRRERALRTVNADLTEQVGETQRGHDEMRRLSLELEKRVADRTAELHETVVELETFNYSASHDLRGPLGAIINFAAILKEDHGDRLGAGVEHLDRIVNSAGVAVSMMDALLAYSRAGRTELRRGRLAMQPLVEDVVAEITASACPDCNVMVGTLPDAIADESMVRHVLMNLIGNACKFVARDAKPQVEIGGHVEGDEAVYFVRDQGVGFDMRFADKLFKVFERLHTVADGYVGHGVGLAIVARAIRRHGGRVWAQGAEGRGATFWFTLPRADEGAAAAERDGRSPT